MEMTANIGLGQPPVPSHDWALFLDIDGTLLDIAPRPDAVRIPPHLPATLAAVSRRLGGALAVVSGRPIAAIDSILAPLSLPCAAEHGAVLRLPDGDMQRPGDTCRVPDSWRNCLEQAAKQWDGVIVDSKTYSVAMHYRLAPERRHDVQELVHGIAAGDPEFEVIPARMAFELRHRSLHKGTAVFRFMQEYPFIGRMPVFVGDDVTDEDGFAACRELGGLGLHVDSNFAGQPANVLKWLKEFADASA